MICPTFPDPYYFIFASGVPDLLYYSHIPTAIISLLIGIFVYFGSKKSLPGKFLLAISICFSFWVLFDLVLWTNNSTSILIFFWSFFGILYGLISVFSLLFYYSFTAKQTPKFWVGITSLSLLLPIFIIAPTKYYLDGIDLDLCGAAGFENIFYVGYYTIVGLIVAVWIFLRMLKLLKNLQGISKKQLIFITVGIEAFLFFFFNSGFFVSYLVDQGYIKDYGLEQYGLFGMTIFMALLAFVIVRFKAFNIKLIGAQALIISLVILIGSQFFYIQSNTNRILTGISLIIVGAIGINLIRSVKKEIEQREKIEKLADELEIANEQQVKLIHFITHQVKGFFTKSRNIFASVLEGDYGVFPLESKHIIEEGLKSDTKAVDTVQEILNAANIRKGTMALNMKILDLKNLVEKGVEKQREVAEHKGLVLETKIADGNYSINGDEDQLEHAIRNLIDNSIKYTPKGKITIELSRSENKINLSVSDTGVGITPDDMKNLFKEGGRGKDSVKVNVDSTGYGLYIVKNIIEAHKGKIHAESEGQDKGSKFIVEFLL